jgi:hypothetical protein
MANAFMKPHPSVISEPFEETGDIVELSSIKEEHIQLTNVYIVKNL